MLQNLKASWSAISNASRPTVVVYSLLIVFFALTAWRLCGYSLVWDDWYLLSDRSLNSIWGPFAGNPQTLPEFYYRPLGELLFYLSNLLVGDNVELQYYISILMLFVVGFILYLILTLFTVNKRLASIIVAVFLVCPLATYTYAWIANRFELDYIIFYLLSYYLFLLFFLGKVRTPAIILLSLISFGLSLMCKELSISLPFVVLLTIFIYASKDRIVNFRLKKKYIILVLPYFILLGVYLVVARVLLMGNIWAGESVYHSAPIMVQIAAIIFQYIRAAISSFLPLTMFFSVWTFLGWVVLMLLNICLFWRLVIRRGIGLEQKKHIVFLVAFILIVSVPLIKSPSARLLSMQSIPLSVLIGYNIHVLADEYRNRFRLLIYPLITALVVVMMLFSISVQNMFHPGTKWVISTNAGMYCSDQSLPSAMKSRMRSLYFDKYPQYVDLVGEERMLYFPRYDYDCIENFAMDSFLVDHLRDRGILE
jgi:hypothetical protein